MTIRQVHVKEPADMQMLESLIAIQPNLVMAFGHASFFEDGSLGTTLKQKFPDATLVGCSSAGEIAGKAVYNNTLVVTAACFPKERFVITTARVQSSEDSHRAGEQLGKELSTKKIVSVFILAPGLNINGSDFVDALAEHLPPEVIVTGGLAGDDVKFQKTYTLWNEHISSDTVVALGIYGDELDVGYGSQGGWEPFGIERRVTKSKSNVLFELDGKSALKLYKEYLGDLAKNLPSSGLYFPFAVQGEEGYVIRTILSVDDTAGSLTFAGNMPEGSVVRLMHAKTGDLIAGATRASKLTYEGTAPMKDSLAILVSCVGRKLVMGDDVDEEIDAVKQSFGAGAVLAGFYSYGEICALNKKNRKPCLHNQTMTITRLTQAS